MDWIRENKPLAAILGVITRRLSCPGLFLFDAWSSTLKPKTSYLNHGQARWPALKSSRLAPLMKQFEGQAGAGG
jgi:hypothetical protein